MSADELTPAETLRAAAKVLRERSEAATSGPWAWEAPSSDNWPTGDQSLYGADDSLVLYGWGYDASGIDATAADRTYVATMHPGVGLALADWLDSQYSDASEVMPSAYDIARLILGAS
jgi:hypothetical protein